MKRKTSEKNYNDRETKRQRLMECDINLKYLFDHLPLEIWVDHIIPCCAKDWLCVSKEWHSVALTALFKDPRLKEKDPRELCLLAIQLGNTSTIQTILRHFTIIRVELFREAIKHKQKEALKTLIEESTDQSGYVDKDSKFLPEVMRSIIQYEGADILSFIYSNIKFTWSAKKYIGDDIENTLIFRDTFKKIIQDTEAKPKWLQEILLSSSSRGDSEIVEILLATRVDISSLDTVQFLVRVVRRCNLNTLLLLLKHPQFSFTPKQLGNTLKSASEYTSKEVVEYILNRNDIPDRSLKGALSQACIFGRLDIVTLLLNDSRINPAENNNYPLRWAAYYGQKEIVQLLMNQPQVDPSAKDFVTVYHLVRHNDLDSLNILLEDSRVKGKLNIIDIALYACNIGQLQILNYILETFEIDPSFDSNDLLFAAMNNNQIDIFNWLLKDSRIDPSIDDNEAIRHAKNSNYTTFVKILLQDNRVNPLGLNEQTFFGNT